MSFSDLPEAPGEAPVRGFLLSVFGAAAITALGFTAFVFATSGTDYSGFVWFGTVYTFIVATIIIALAAIFIGLPLTWVLSRSRLEQPWTYPLVGFIAGAAVAASPRFFEGGSGSFVQILPFTLIGAVPGCVCGTIWWVTYRRHRQLSGIDAGAFD